MRKRLVPVGFTRLGTSWVKPAPSSQRERYVNALLGWLAVTGNPGEWRSLADRIERVLGLGGEGD